VKTNQIFISFDKGKNFIRRSSCRLTVTWWVSQVVQEPQTLSEYLILVGSCCSIFSILCSFCRSLFVFFVWSLHCLSFDLRLLVTPLVSSNFSYLRHMSTWPTPERVLSHQIAYYIRLWSVYHVYFIILLLCCFFGDFWYDR
jgi:hypothetical protein